LDQGQVPNMATMKSYAVLWALALLSQHVVNSIKVSMLEGGGARKHERNLE